MNFKNETRGFRNNNPGNIRFGNNWVGEIEGADSSFETFASVEYGIRAIYVLINTYKLRYNDVTAFDIIHRYAPTTENQTNHYINAVVSCIKQLTNQEITSLTDLHQANVIDELIAAIIKHENGFNPFSIDFIKGCKNVN